MARMTRRDFLKASGSAAFAVSGLAGCASMGGAPTATTTPSELMPTTGRRVIVVGGGWAGATAAKYVRMEDPSLEVVLIEPNRKFISCPFSNLVLSGVRSIGSLTFGYNGLREQNGGKTLHESATAIEPATRRVRLDRGFLGYERLIVAPGIEFQTEQIEGLAAAGDRVLHAWKAGPQTVALARQLKEMPDGGVFVMSVPPAAYRCPPGPYERACQVAWYLKTRKPRAKLIVLDANQNVISKTALFRAAWQAYPNLEYRASSRVVKVDPEAREVTTEFGDKVRYDVVNVIPPQRAGAIAVQADLSSSRRRWRRRRPPLPVRSTPRASRRRFRAAPVTGVPARRAPTRCRAWPACRPGISRRRSTITPRAAGRRRRWSPSRRWSRRWAWTRSRAISPRSRARRRRSRSTARPS